MTVLVTKTNLMTRKSRAIGMQYKGITLKPWQGDNLGLLATPFGQGLRVLALTCDNLRSLWSSSNLHASRRKCFTVWPPNLSQRKFSDFQ